VATLGASDIDKWLKMRLVNGIIYRSKWRRIKLCIHTLPCHSAPVQEVVELPSE
jgi:hypothetical protein